MTPQIVLYVCQKAWACHCQRVCSAACVSEWWICTSRLSGWPRLVISDDVEPWASWGSGTTRRGNQHMFCTKSWLHYCKLLYQFFLWKTVQLRVLSPKNGTILESGYRVQTCDCNKWMRYMEYIGEIHFFLPIYPFFGNQPRRARQGSTSPSGLLPRMLGV